MAFLQCSNRSGFSVIKLLYSMKFVLGASALDPSTPLKQQQQQKTLEKNNHH